MFKYCVTAILVVIAWDVIVVSAAEPRTWVSRDGQYSVKAELVRAEGGKVVLRKQDGVTVEVAIDKLTESDVQLVREAFPESRPFPVSTVPVELAATLQTSPAGVESAANLYRTAREAITLYRAYYSAFPAPPTARFSVDSSLAKWQKLSDERHYRLGRSWLTQEECRRVRQAAHDLVIQALRQLEEQAGDQARSSLTEAARLDPYSASANNIIGLTYAISLRNYEQAKGHFAEALRRDPLDPTATNNLGIVELRTGNSAAAVARWMQAIELAPTSKEIQHNLFHLFSEIENKTVAEPSTGMTPVRALQKRLIEYGVSDPIPNTGWLYLPPQACDDPQNAISNNSVGSQDKTIYASRQAGFVVYPNHVLTYIDHFEASGVLFVSRPEDEPLKAPQRAQVIAYDDATGLLLLKVAELKTPPIPMAAGFPRAGTNLAVAGFTKPTHFSDSRIAMRSVLVSVPSAESHEHFLCTTRVGLGPGASPIADASGSVVGVALLNPKLGQPTAVAISNRVVKSFLTKQISEYGAKVVTQPQQSWDKVDTSLLRSLVLVETCKVLQYDYCAALRKPADVDTLRVSDESVLEDVYCNRCRGLGAVNCPVRGCANGGVLVEVRTAIGSANGQTLYRYDKVRTPCDYCNGQGKVSCPACTNGRASGL